MFVDFISPFDHLPTISAESLIPLEHVRSDFTYFKNCNWYQRSYFSIYSSFEKIVKGRILMENFQESFKQAKVIAELEGHVFAKEDERILEILFNLSYLKVLCLGYLNKK